MASAPESNTLSNEEWEALCDGCGKCCGLSQPKDGTGVACPGLNVQTNRCTVYKKRLTTHICLEVRPDNVLTLHGRGILPDSCAYVLHTLGQSPLDRPVEEAKLIPFALAPLQVRRNYRSAQKRWLKEKG